MSFDSAVDPLITEVFIDISPKADDSSFGCPAVIVAAKGV